MTSTRFKMALATAAAEGRVAQLGGLYFYPPGFDNPDPDDPIPGGCPVAVFLQLCWPGPVIALPASLPPANVAAASRVLVDILVEDALSWLRSEPS